MDKLGREPTATEIKDDSDMPCYNTFIRRVGGKKELNRKLEIKTDPRKLNSLLCRDCVKDPRYCNKDYDQCVEEAKLYFEMLNQASYDY